ncbi:hypothetical protein RF371_11635 [Companilactobacillus paralimentarius]|uniref:hypothetical protein n=1 Tax=Companilactobacillus paralimentarius TaxID=83526 RepID=UPI00285303FE|nr:hypothetical protein [Companilactobacillus paralimentarius]MDR4934443.1 hypothetical protein [Companilactobacillus paralimentarius]
MNKTKVMQILNSIDLGLNIIEEGQQLDTQVLTESVRTDVEDLKEELNSKPVMPKVFDEWDCEEHECCDCCEMEIENLISMYFKNDLASDNGRMLLKWINQGEFKENTVRLLKCIDAIRYGYEVEK